MFGHVRSSSWISSRISQVRSSHVYPDPSRASPQFLRSVSSQALINGLPRALRHILIAGLLWIALTDLTLAESGGLTALGFRGSAGKGAIFVLLSTGLVFWRCSREYRNILRTSSLLRAVVEGTSDAVFVKGSRRQVLARQHGRGTVHWQTGIRGPGPRGSRTFRFDGR